MIPPKATGKKINESAVSPTTVDQIARAEKLRPPLAIFIRLITYAFKNEPTRKADKLAITIRGAIPKTKLK